MNPSWRERTLLASAISLALVSASSPAYAADECGTGPVVVCDTSGNPYANGVVYRGQNVNLTLRSGAVVDTTAGTPPGASATLSAGFAARAAGSTNNAGNVVVTVEPGARIVGTQTGVRGIVVNAPVVGNTATVVNHGDVSTSGASGRLIAVIAGGAIDITSTGSLVSTGIDGEGIFAFASSGDGPIRINHSGSIQVGASDTDGIVAIKSQLMGDINVLQTGVVEAGRDGISIQNAPSGNNRVMVENSGSVSGVATGVRFDGPGAQSTLNNSGSISAPGPGGVGIEGSRAVLAIDNAATGMISGDIGVNANYGISPEPLSLSVTNTGSIVGSAGAALSAARDTGVSAINTVVVGNRGTMAGSGTGVALQNVNAIINNLTGGTLRGVGSAGVHSSGGGVLSLANAGLIEGAVGINLANSGSSIVNAGTVTGTGGNAIFINGDDNLLTLGTGSAINGNVSATGSRNQLILEGDGVEDSGFTGFSRLTVLGNAWRLGGSSDFSEGAVIERGTLMLDGATLTTPSVAVASSGSLGGAGTVSGAVAIAAGGALLGQQGQTLTMGSLLLNPSTNVNVALGAPAATTLFNVAGDLTLAGTLNIADLGGFGAGVYRLFDYGGVLTDNGLDLGSLPVGVTLSDLLLQTSVAQQVNLINAAGVTLSFWDGTGAANNGAIDGGDGVWDAGNRNWADVTGTLNGVWKHDFAIFQGDGGTVTVDNGLGDITVTGIQFTSAGYFIEGDALALIAPETLIRVGTGAFADADITAEIGAALAGPGNLVKTDFGTLVLSGDSSSFAGSTSVRGGTLRVTGSLGGQMQVQAGGRLEGTGTVGSTVLASGGTIAPGTSIGTLTLAGDFVGQGGTLLMETALADDASATDHLIIEGSSSGQAQVQVVNVGGAGAQTDNGIQLIRVDGASDAEFALAGRTVGGLYEYFLFKGGRVDPNDGDWYLRSQLPEEPEPELPVLRPEPGAYLANQAAATALFHHRMHERTGEPNLGGDRRGAWARVTRDQADHGLIGEQLTVNSDRSTLHLGTDLFDWGLDSRGVLGVMGAMGQAHNRVASELTGFAAKGRVEGAAAGVYGSWFQRVGEPTGAYVDGWVQYARYRHRVDGDGLPSERYDAHTATASVEAGYAWSVYATERMGVYVEPQVQLSYTDYTADRHVERTGTVVDVDEAGGLSARLGVRLYGHATAAEGAVVQPFAAVNWLREARDNALRFDGERLEGGLPANRYELQAGVQVVGRRWAGWGTLGVQSGDGEYREVGGQLGLRFQW